MDKDCKNFVQSCIVCQRFKGNTHPLVPLGRVPIPDRKFHSIAVDLIGPLPPTMDGNKYILTAIDYTTRYTLVTPLRSKNAKEVAEAIWTTIVAQWGCPKVIVSDQGTEFRNSVLRRMAELGGFDHRMVTVYHPASNGLVENANAQIITILKCIVDDLSPLEWDKNLGTVQLALNSAYHSSLGDTPYFCVYQADPDIPNAAFANLSPKYNVDELAAATFRIFDKVRDNLERAAEGRELQRMKKAKSTELSIHQRVFVRRPKKKGDHKLTPKWRGPYRVIEKVRPHVYRLEELGTSKRTRVHLENMKVCPEATVSRQLVPTARKIFREQIPRGNNTPPGASWDASSDEEEDFPGRADADSVDGEQEERNGADPDEVGDLIGVSDEADALSNPGVTPADSGEEDVEAEVEIGHDTGPGEDRLDRSDPGVPVKHSSLTQTTRTTAETNNPRSVYEERMGMDGANTQPGVIGTRRVTRSRNYGPGYYKELMRGKAP